MKKYTLGFIFNSTLDKVLLIHKLRPEWQLGKLNGLGGKVEEGENSLTCITREILEESGLITEKDLWIKIGSMNSPEKWTVDVFGYAYKGDMNNVKSIEDEQVEWFDINSLPSNVHSNLTWLIPMTLDKIKNNKFNTAFIEYEL